MTDGTWSYEWEHGRQLAKMTGADSTITYGYNADGLRVSKNVDGTVYHYHYVGDRLVEMTWGSNTMHFYYDAIGPAAVKYNGKQYYYLRNAQGDIIRIYTANGTTYGAYEYDAWGNILFESTTAVCQANPLRYRGYVYDKETGLYYLNSRYYNPNWGRFISVDTVSVLGVQGNLYDKNLFAYCDNNPVVRVDRGGQFWESAFDVISFGASVVEVCVNPTDIWAWAGLVGDAVDLIPFVTGVGEVTRAVKTTVKVVDNAEDVLDAANTLYKTADAASDIRKATGSYEIVYKSGKNYIGKGSFNRAMTSARAHAESVDDILSIRWKSAPFSRDAFIDEYLMQKRFGGVLSVDQALLTHNKIWSPGRRYYGR